MTSSVASFESSPFKQSRSANTWNNLCLVLVLLDAPCSPFLSRNLYTTNNLLIVPRLCGPFLSRTFLSSSVNSFFYLILYGFELLPYSVWARSVVLSCILPLNYDPVVLRFQFGPSYCPPGVESAPGPFSCFEGPASFDFRRSMVQSCPEKLSYLRQVHVFEQ